MLRWIVLLLASSLSAQVAPAPKYKVVKDGKIAAVNALADQGYRVLVPGRLLIMRLDSTPPDTYRYVARNAEEGHVQFLNWLNEQGAHGYRWVPGGSVVEKEPHPKNYEYSFIAPARPSFSGKINPETISSLTGQGYHPVDSVSFSALIGPGGTEPLFQREVGAKAKSMPTSEGWEIETAHAAREANMLKQLNVLGKKGYHYLWRYYSAGGMWDWMQKCEAECEQGFEYRYFDVHDIGQLAKELNEQGKGGFRVVPERLISPPHLLERAGGESKTYEYHVVHVKDQDLEPLEQALNAPEQEGYVPIGYVWRVGWTGDEFLLLEKASTASALR